MSNYPHQGEDSNARRQDPFNNTSQLAYDDESNESDEYDHRTRDNYHSEEGSADQSRERSEYSESSFITTRSNVVLLMILLSCNATQMNRLTTRLQLNRVIGMVHPVRFKATLIDREQHRPRLVITILQLNMNRHLILA